MKKIFLIYLSIFLTTSHAEMACVSNSDSEVKQCSEVISSQENQSCSFFKENNEVNDQKDIYTNIKNHQIDICSESDIEKLYGTSFNKAKKSLKKQCKQKAKSYKKALIKDLLQNKKYIQAFKVLLKRKKRSIENIEGDNQTVSMSSTEDELLNTSSEELEKMLMDKLEHKIPGIKDQAQSLMENNLKFKDGFHVNEKTPYSLIISNADEGLCQFTVNDFPERPIFKDKDCRFCNGINIQDSFVNDCSYMVTSEFNEKKVDQLLKINNENRNEYCQKDMKNKKYNSDMSHINDVANEICEMAQNGKKPDFTIETSRNLYPDKTPNLAKKRGTFIKTYIYDQLKHNCKLKNDAFPIIDKDKFNNAIKVKHPAYADAKEGDYGPDPFASGKEDQDKEILKLKKSLNNEKEKIVKEISSRKKLIKQYEDEIASMNSKVDINKKQYLNQKKRIEKETDLIKAQKYYSSEKSNSIKNLLENTTDLYQSISSKQQKLTILQKENQSFQIQLKKYEDNGVDLIEEKAKLLQKFYTESNKNGIGPDRRKYWDKKLFDDFKMVRVKGSAKEETDSFTNDYDISPKLDIMLNLAVKSDEIACIVEPHSTKKLKLKGAIKGIGLAFMGGVAITAGLATGAGVLAIGIPNTILSLLCVKNCNHGSEAWRKYRLIGDMTKLKSKNTRKRIKRGVKSTMGNIMTLNGRLGLKAGSDYNYYEYNDFDKYMRKHAVSEEDHKQLREKNLTVTEVKNAKGKLEIIEMRDKYGDLYETREFDENGKLIYITRFNKDEDEIKVEEF